MSADNGVYILTTQGDEYVTKSGKLRRKTEFRVAEAQAIENIFERWSSDEELLDKPILSVEYAQLYFGNCRVLTSRRIAEGYAQALLDLASKDFYVEYGIVPLEFRHVRFPKRHLRLVA